MDAEVAAPKSPTIADRVRQLVAVKQQKEKLKTEQEAAMKKLDEIYDALAHMVQTYLDTNGLQNLKVDDRVCYIYRRYSAPIQDKQAFMDYVKQNNKWDLLDVRANATAVREFAEANNALPTGCSLNTLSQLGVRKTT